MESIKYANLLLLILITFGPAHISMQRSSMDFRGVGPQRDTASHRCGIPQILYLLLHSWVKYATVAPDTYISHSGFWYNKFSCSYCQSISFHFISFHFASFFLRPIKDAACTPYFSFSYSISAFQCPSISQYQVVPAAFVCRIFVLFFPPIFSHFSLVYYAVPAKVLAGILAYMKR